ncbi:MAG: hypothetical protein KAT10_02375 [Sulfurimonas sp.]|nr:hypothetical protein [Sulfurimonas sp.]
MGFRINTNIAAMNSHRNAVNTNLGLDKSLNSLSSGLRINKAADDASGMTIADSLRSQAQGLGQAINNANDGVAVIQTADGALDEYINIINTIRTKSIQAASDGQNSDSRLAIQADIDRLLEAANGIATTTQFNGQQLLDGSYTNKAFHIGAYAGETVNLSVGNTQTNAVGDITSFEGASTRTSLVIDTEIEVGETGYTMMTDALKINGEDISASINKLSPERMTDAASVAAAITDATGLVAEGNNSLTGAAAVTIDALTYSGDIDATNFLKINGVAIADTTVVAGDSDGALVRAINDISGQTGVTATISSDKKLQLESVDGSNISISTAVKDVDTITFGAAAVTADIFTIANSLGGSVTYTATTGETAASIADGIAALMNSSETFGATATVVGGVVTVTQSVNSLTDAVVDGDMSFAGSTGITISTTETTADVNVAKLTGLTTHNLTDEVGAATATIASTVSASVVIGKGELVINGMDLAGTYGDGVVKGSAGQELLEKIQKISGMEDSYLGNDGKLTLVVNNGDDLNISGAGAASYGFTAGVSNESKIGSIEMYSTENIIVAGNSADAFGLTSGTKAVSSKDVSLKDDLDVTTRAAAEISILMTDSALKQLDSTRADLGSVQNQLESTIRNISVTQVNVTAAESQIRDVDFAKESANFAKLNILAQSGSYAMSQANAVQQNVMRLLQ